MRTAVTDDSATQPDAGAMADAERLMELAQAWVDAETRYENCTFTGTEDELIEEGRKCSAAEAAFRKALFAQPDAGAMAEADNIARNMAIDLVACHIAFAGTSRDDVAALTVTKDMTRQIADALNAHAARREAAGFARGCEEAAKATESWFAEWSPKDAMNGRMCSAAIRTLASAGRALLGENAND
jgi:hypothetical protein